MSRSSRSRPGSEPTRLATFRHIGCSFVLSSLPYIRSCFPCRRQPALGIGEVTLDTKGLEKGLVFFLRQFALVILVAFE